MTTTTPTATTPATDGAERRRRVLEVLRTRCAAARLPELARATALGELEVLDALYELERDGMVTPTVWRLADLGESDT